MRVLLCPPPCSPDPSRRRPLAPLVCVSSAAARHLESPPPRPPRHSSPRRAVRAKELHFIVGLAPPIDFQEKIDAAQPAEAWLASPVSTPVLRATHTPPPPLRLGFRCLVTVSTERTHTHSHYGQLLRSRSRASQCRVPAVHTHATALAAAGKVPCTRLHLPTASPQQDYQPVQPQYVAGYPDNRYQPPMGTFPRAHPPSSHFGHSRDLPRGRARHSHRCADVRPARHRCGS